MSVGAGAPSPRGRFVDIGGRRLRLVCEGPQGGGPTVVLEAGAFGFAADWAVVQERLAARGVRSCAYDRAGMGYSDPGSEPRDGVAVAEDLERLLAASGERGPYVLVGHSMAGTRIWLFYQRNRNKVAGLTFVDAATPDLVGSSQFQPFLSSFAALSHAAAGVAWAGLLKPFSFTADSIGLPPEAAAEKRWAFGDSRHNHTSASEVAQWSRAAGQALAAGASLDPKLPVAVITAGHGAGGHLEEAYAAPARRAEHGYFANVASASHADLLGFRFADEIVKGVDFVLAHLPQERTASPSGAMADG
jgi:pimeloyl-ACP methyl ester carboxylesterase